MKSHIFKFAPIAVAAALAFAVSPLQAAPRGGGGGHGGGGHAGGHSGGGRGGHMGGGHGFSRGGGSFRGGHTFAHGGRAFRGGPGFRGRGWGGPGPFYYGLGLGYPYYGYYGAPYDDGAYADDGDNSSACPSSAVDNTAATVQQALAGAGYYHGAIDGIIGPGSTAAISAYQRDHGLPANGVINTALLRSLGIN